MYIYLYICYITCFFFQEFIFPYLVPTLLGVIHVSLTGSVYTTIAVAVERCVTVCAPFTTIEVLQDSMTFNYLQGLR